MQHPDNHRAPFISFPTSCLSHEPKKRRPSLQPAPTDARSFSLARRTQIGPVQTSQGHLEPCIWAQPHHAGARHPEPRPRLHSSLAAAPPPYQPRTVPDRARTAGNGTSEASAPVRHARAALLGSTSLPDLL